MGTVAFPRGSNYTMPLRKRKETRRRWKRKHSEEEADSTTKSLFALGQKRKTEIS